MRAISIIPAFNWTERGARIAERRAPYLIVLVSALVRFVCTPLMKDVAGAESSRTPVTVFHAVDANRLTDTDCSEQLLTTQRLPCNRAGCCWG